MFNVGDLVNLLDHPDASEEVIKYGVVIKRNEETSPAILKVIIFGPGLESYTTTEDEVEPIEIIK